MRKWSILILMVLVGCSKTPLDHAKKAVSKNIGHYLNDPSYYESVAWGTLDSAFYANFYETPRATKLLDSCISTIPLKNERFRVELNKIIKKTPPGKRTIPLYNFFKDYEGMTLAETEKIFDLHLKNYHVESNNFKPLFKGYEISHTFRARGTKKEKALMKYLFTLDTLYNVIDATKQEVAVFDSSNP